MSKNYNEMERIYLNSEQYQLLKEIIFMAFGEMDMRQKNMACEIVHEINSAIEELKENRVKRSAPSEEESLCC